MPMVLATDTATMSTITAGATELLTWVLTAATSIVTWVVGNPLALLLACMFITGFAVSMLMRILHSI